MIANEVEKRFLVECGTVKENVRRYKIEKKIESCLKSLTSSILIECWAKEKKIQSIFRFE